MPIDDLRLLSSRASKTTAVAPAGFHCKCGEPVFFRNSRCVSCNSPLGYEPNLRKIVTLEPGATEDLWRLGEDAENSGQLYRRCDNLFSAAACNWIVPVSDNGAIQQTLCQCCRLDRTIPDLSNAADQEAYHRISIAKRRLVACLITLGLPVASRISEDVEHGVAFDFLRSPSVGPRILTGYENGIITLNIEEAEDSRREQIRLEMGEAYRTLLGHLRHETGHYYWDRLIAGTAWIDDFRDLFGDEREDYAAALQTRYQQGPPLGWEARCVSAYAGVHPWEDWAETWAHYLHMMDTIDCALGLGLDPDSSIEMEVKPFTADALFRPEDPEGPRFLHFINSWTRLTAALNELSRAMGFNDFYPFVWSPRVVAKLHFVHLVVCDIGAAAESESSTTAEVAELK
jgi:hypothetical protein